MSATYTVTDVVGEPREWQSKHGGTFLSYRVALKDVEGVVELSQKPETPAPKAGDLLAGEILPAQGSFPPKFRKEKRDFGGGGGGRSAQDWEASGRAQGRAHAQEMALTYAALKNKTDATWGEIMALADKFFDDAQAAKAEGYRS